jgi:tetratricopeptide (TPR) repeat protein
LWYGAFHGLGYSSFFWKVPLFLKGIWVNRIFTLLEAQGDLAGTKPYYERALAIRKQVLGPQHPDTAFSLTNLGALLEAQGDLAGAKPYYERALQICRLRLGKDHALTQTVLAHLEALEATE